MGAGGGRVDVGNLGSGVGPEADHEGEGFGPRGPARMRSQGCLLGGNGPIHEGLSARHSRPRPEGPASRYPLVNGGHQNLRGRS